MSFPAYPDYKDSGIEWLGEVPAHWKEKPFFSLVSERCESNAGMKHENLLSLSYGRIVNKDINALDGLLPASFETYQVVHPGDIVFRLTDLQNDKRSLRSAIVRETGIITSAYLAGICRGIFPEFASFLFRAYDTIKVFYSMGGGLRQSMKYSDMKWLPVWLPDWQEQTQIARFLDHETTRIDALIEEQQRLIELLKEKRQAVISHAVTKGLDPTVPMKDSGVEWLGEVPAHWGITDLKYLVTSIGQGWSPQCDNFPAEEGEWGVLKVGCVNGGVFNASENKRLPDELAPDEALAIKKNDLLISRANTRELVGSAAVAGQDYPLLMLCDKLYRVCLDVQRICPKYLAFYLGSSAPRGQIELAASGASDSMQNISQSAIMDMVLPLPEVCEQELILQYLNSNLEIVDEMVLEVKSQLQLLQERRSALISAAVTGKIDVRGWQPPAGTPSPESAIAEAH